MSLEAACGAIHLAAVTMLLLQKNYNVKNENGSDMERKTYIQLFSVCIYSNKPALW